MTETCKCPGISRLLDVVDGAEQLDPALCDLDRGQARRGKLLAARAAGANGALGGIRLLLSQRKCPLDIVFPHLFHVGPTVGHAASAAESRRRD